MRLYTYKMAVDQGAAPNPFHGQCTLAICKPAIRRSASVGDWVAGIGSQGLGYPDKLVYAMQVEQSLSMRDYYLQFPQKRPDWNSGIFEKQAGDNIYDLQDPLHPRMLKSVHNIYDMERDLSGKNVLISSTFYYFGDQAPFIPKSLSFIGEVNRGHRNSFLPQQIQSFLEWIEGWQPGIHGYPIDGGDFLICQ